MGLHPGAEGGLRLRHEGAQARGLFLQALRFQAGLLKFPDGALLRAHVRRHHHFRGNGGAGVGDGVGCAHHHAETAGDGGEDPPCTLDDAVIDGVAGVVDLGEARLGGLGELVAGLEHGFVSDTGALGDRPREVIDYEDRPLQGAAVNPRTWEGVNLLLSFSYTARGGLISPLPGGLLLGSLYDLAVRPQMHLAGENSVELALC